MDGSKQWQRSIWNDGRVNSDPAVTLKPHEDFVLDDGDGDGGSVGDDDGGGDGDGDDGNDDDDRQV